VSWEHARAAGTRPAHENMKRVLVCLWRVGTRALWFHGRNRPDMAPGCTERLSPEFVQWIWTYPARRRPDFLTLELASETRE
jgi:hypothetical protein